MGTQRCVEVIEIAGTYLTHKDIPHVFLFKTDICIYVVYVLDDKYSITHTQRHAPYERGRQRFCLAWEEELPLLVPLPVRLLPGRRSWAVFVVAVLDVKIKFILSELVTRSELTKLVKGSRNLRTWRLFIDTRWM